MDYKDLNDYELVYQVRESDDVAYSLIVKKYSHLVDMLARIYLKKNRNIGIEYEDLFQEGMVGILKALDDYDAQTLFYTYASLCAKREMERLIKAHKRNKHMILNNAVSLNLTLKDNDDIVLEDLIPSPFNLEKYYISECNYNKMIDFKYELDLDDSPIYELKLNGFSTDEIAILLDKNYKYIDNHLHKIRKKLLQFI